MNTSQVKRAILKLYPDYTTVYGPYTAESNKYRRMAVLYNYRTGEQKSTSWAKLVYEAHTKQRIEAGYEVDHKNDDFTNDKFSNLQLLTKADNIRKELARRDGKFYDWTRTKSGREFLKRKIQGEKNTNALFSDKDVTLLRKKYSKKKITRQEIMSEYGVSDRATRNMLTGISYSHLSGSVSLRRGV